MKTFSILVADDHAVVRHGVRTLLEVNPAWKVVAQARNGREAVHLARELKPDLAVLDISMPSLNGIEAARRIAGYSPETRLLILSVYDSEELLERAISSGAHGFVQKSEAESELATAVCAVLNNKLFFPSHASAALHRRRSGNGRRLPSELTSREMELIQLIAEGHSNKEIASMLDISRRTVENHRANIMRKLGLRSSSELVRFAVRHGIVTA